MNWAVLLVWLIVVGGLIIFLIPYLKRLAPLIKEFYQKGLNTNYNNNNNNNMPQALIYLDKEEDDMVMKYHEQWKLSKQDTIKKMIREFEKEVLNG